MNAPTRLGVIRFVKPDLQAQFGEVAVSSDDTLMDALLKLGLPVASSCRGDGVCTKCRLHVKELAPGALSGISQFEQGLLDRIMAEDDERISCQVRTLGPIEVDADYW
jgi:2Fe-2S ferredoxin